MSIEQTVLQLAHLLNLFTWWSNRRHQCPLLAVYYSCEYYDTETAWLIFELLIVGDWHFEYIHNLIQNAKNMRNYSRLICLWTWNPRSNKLLIQDPENPKINKEQKILNLWNNKVVDNFSGFNKQLQYSSLSSPLSECPDYQDLYS
jgi:hypothetical protein